MPIAVDQVNVGEFALDSSASTIAVTTSATVASGGFIVLYFTWVGPSVTLSSVSGGGLTWTIDKQGESTGLDPDCDGAIVSAPAPAGLASGTTITGTLSAATVGGCSVAATSFTGVLTPGSVDTTAGPSDYTTTAWTVSMTTSGSAVLVAGAMDFHTSDTSTITSPSVEAHDFGAAGGFEQTVGYRIEPAAGTYTVAGTWAASATGTALGVAYKAAVSAAASAPFTPHRMPLGV
jgi:hypothetical protein